MKAVFVLCGYGTEANTAALAAKQKSVTQEVSGQTCRWRWRQPFFFSLFTTMCACTYMPLCFCWLVVGCWSFALCVCVHAWQSLIGFCCSQLTLKRQGGVVFTKQAWHFLPLTLSLIRVINRLQGRPPPIIIRLTWPWVNRKSCSLHKKSLHEHQHVDMVMCGCYPTLWLSHTYSMVNNKTHKQIYYACWCNHSFLRCMLS